ncbi:nuclear transport factor 2 family protein [Actinomadura bangladeshensis]|uniref:Nuclear transport factor 2 family protein n=1 Tax=Actinomadura bangladeshensis TaxID=453573 RepID=A0A4R4PE16_9ACTN|nr:nuclear transport factor 2 family protein [Actinomadura bangladeshensis]TDC19032.1 nuclear transport factor 2 family protein [Actinomadura bangladeshensis]
MAVGTPVDEGYAVVDADGAWAVMEKFYAAEAAYVAAGGYGRADYGQVAVYVDPDVVLHQAPGLPFTGTGTWRGRDGLERFLAVFSDLWESIEFLEQEHWGDDDTVVVHNRVRFRARSTGREVETLIMQLIKVRDGRMLECRPFYWDPSAIAGACARTPPHTQDASAE